jgi:hypothetical protein
MLRDAIHEHDRALRLVIGFVGPKITAPPDSGNGSQTI